MSRFLFIPLVLCFSCEEKKEKDCAGLLGGNNTCGCTDSTSTNYNYQATYDDGSCNFQSHDFNQLEQLELEIMDIIGIPGCSDDSSCRYIGFGAKPCGGYWEYLVYSMVNVDSIALADKIDQYNEYNDSLNVRYEISSDCNFIYPPTIHCDNGVCIGN